MDKYTKAMLLKIKNARTLSAAKAFAGSVLLNEKLRLAAREKTRKQAQLVEIVYTGHNSDSLINVIKAMRTHFDLGLKEAADIVRIEGSHIFPAMPKERADMIARDLLDAGARFVVRGARPKRQPPRIR